MRTLSTLLLSLSFAFSSAASTDLSVSLAAISGETGQAATRVPAQTSVIFEASVGGSGSEIPQNVVLEIDIPVDAQVRRTDEETVTCAGQHPIRCTITPRLGFLAYVTAEAVMTVPGPVTATARVTSSTPDDRPGNNTASVTVDVVDKPSLRVSGPSGDARYRVEPGQSTSMSVFVENRGSTATNVVLTSTLTNGGTLTQYTTGGTAPAQCTMNETTIVCTAPVMPHGTYFNVDLRMRAPERLTGGDLILRSSVTSKEGDFDPADDVAQHALPVVRHILVENTRDEGEGSLRQALLDASSQCTTAPCVVDFRIAEPLPASGYYTIQPRTPLPVVGGFTTIDGATQTRFGGDTNPQGPEIEINGSLVSYGNGLNLGEGCEVRVLNVAVNGFAGSGIEASRRTADYTACNRFALITLPNTLIAKNYVGVDARGENAVPNERGVVFVESTDGLIEDNLLSGNRRSGLYADAVRYLGIRRNRITRNGASGMFLNVGTREPNALGAGADVENNIIAFNEHWGIARTARGEISILGNSIYANRYQGIDVNLDFETPNQANDLNRVPNKPFLTSATYDAASNTTIVQGSVTSKPALFFTIFTVEVFASADLSLYGQPQGQTRVAVLTKELNDREGPGAFTITIPGDLRGQWITATLTRSHFVGFATIPRPSGVDPNSHYVTDRPADTSEFSNAILVQ
ncbi:MAG: right-handed parallel beta-helix repeat-containing protein [Acidobacteriota bacterium]|nr:right-handed parallel beta-helix repeat-containing protein [Acidobacteriota bacterium]